VEAVSAEDPSSIARLGDLRQEWSKLLEKQKTLGEREDGKPQALIVELPTRLKQ
jgi:hypothetical protein